MHPLSLAACRNHPQVVAYLLEKGADKSIKGLHGNTAKDWEIQGNNTDVIQLL